MSLMGKGDAAGRTFGKAPQGSPGASGVVRFAPPGPLPGAAVAPSRSMQAVIDGRLGADLVAVAEKVVAGKRLSFEEGVFLMEHPDVMALGAMADHRRRALVGDEAYYTNNLNLNPTNICVARCGLCAFGVPFDAANTYVVSHEEAAKRAAWAREAGLNEIHVVGGLNPQLSLDWFVRFIGICRENHPEAYIQGFTPVEIDYLSGRAGLDWREVLSRLQDAGLHALPGGGAEVLNDRIHKQMCDHKTGWREWLSIHHVAHSLGMHTNATMLYGHIETAAERIDHMVKLRKQQDRSGGFKAFVPLGFHTKGTAYEHLPGPSGYDDVRVHAVGRLMLDNFPHVKMLWAYTGQKLASVGLRFGVDDLGGTSFDERIVHAAGAATPIGIEGSEIERIMRGAGREPVYTNSGYWGTRWDLEGHAAPKPLPKARGPSPATVAPHFRPSSVKALPMAAGWTGGGSQ